MRVLLKLSGEFLAGVSGKGFDEKILNRITDEIIEIHQAGVELAIVIGGGNLFRGIGSQSVGIDQPTGDNIGMLATIQNALMLSGVIRNKGHRSRVFSIIQMPYVCEFYTPSLAKLALQKGNICFFAGGVGNPYFTTDTAGVLRAIETDCNVLVKGTNVEGVYDKDPREFADAKLYKTLTYSQALSENLRIMDATAFALAKENQKKIVVFDVSKKGNLKKVILEQSVGTVVTDFRS